MKPLTVRIPAAALEMAEEKARAAGTTLARKLTEAALAYSGYRAPKGPSLAEEARAKIRPADVTPNLKKEPK